MSYNFFETIFESVSNKVNLICRRFVTSFFEIAFNAYFAYVVVFTSSVLIFFQYQAGITAGIGMFLAMMHRTPGLLIVMAGLSYRGLMGAILLSIITISVIGWSTEIFSQIVSFSFLSVVFAMFFVDFFDTTGREPAKLRKTDGTIVNLDKAVLSDTSASIFGSLLELQI